MTWDKYIYAIVAIVLAAFAMPAIAADKGGDQHGILGPLTATSSSPWSGCGIGISENYFPNIGGHLVTGNLACDMQAGQVVFGGAIEYGWFVGDLRDAGLDTDITIRGRAGFLINPHTLLFGHVGWARMEGGGDSVDGWKLGPGISINIPNSRAFVDFRYDYGVWDTPIGDQTTHAVVVGLTYKLGAK